jgi:predicted RNA-binding protein YlxR (DUF448 family)
MKPMSFEQLLLRFKARNARRLHRRAYHRAYYVTNIDKRRADARAVKRRRFAREVIAAVTDQDLRFIAKRFR